MQRARWMQRQDAPRVSHQRDRASRQLGGDRVMDRATDDIEIGMITRRAASREPAQPRRPTGWVNRRGVRGRASRILPSPDEPPVGWSRRRTSAGVWPSSRPFTRGVAGRADATRADGQTQRGRDQARRIQNVCSILITCMARVDNPPRTVDRLRVQRELPRPRTWTNHRRAWTNGHGAWRAPYARNHNILWSGRESRPKIWCFGLD